MFEFCALAVAEIETAWLGCQPLKTGQQRFTPALDGVEHLPAPNPVT
jgi:hypothetical protein